MASRSIHLSVHIHKDPAAMAERAAHIFAASCEEAIAERGIFRVALSGGRTPVHLFRLLSRPDWVERLPWEQISLFWVDERCVEPDHADSNFGMARKELLANVPATHFFRMKGEDDPEEAARNYEKLLRREFELRPGELPRFDLMLMGMGEDGHTASIFPDSPLLAEKERLVSDVYVPKLKSDRLTLTLPVINNSRCCMFMVTGADKHELLEKVLNVLMEPELPAQMVRPPIGDLIWIMDEAAARGE